MHSDFFAKAMGNNDARSARSGWSIAGLDLLFPDAGPLETSAEPLEKRIERVAKIIRRWWQILDGKSVDTWGEVGERRQGVLREMGFQYLALLINEEEARADRSITAEDLALYERDLRALEKANKTYLLGVHRYDVGRGQFLDADAPIFVSDPEDQEALDYATSGKSSWVYHLNPLGITSYQCEAKGTAEWVNGKVQISYDSAEIDHIPDYVWARLKELLEPELLDVYLDSLEFGEEPEVWRWSIERPARANPAADIRRHCDDYWKCCLELEHLDKARQSASKSFDQEQVAQFVWDSRAKFLERFLLPAQNLARQPLEQRSSEREYLLVAGWVAAVSKLFPRSAKALMFEHNDAYKGFFIELPGAVISALMGDLNVRQAMRLYQLVNNSITKELDRKEFETIATDIEDLDIEEVGIESDDFAAAFTDVEAKLRASVEGAKLSQGERAIIDLLLKKDRSNVELAQILGKSDSQVGVEKSRAFKKLRETYAGTVAV